MGYRSDVKYVIAFQDKEARDDFVAVQKVAGDKYAQEAIKEWDLEGNDNLIFFEANNWKWYDDYPEVMAHDTLLDASVEAGGAYVFYRLGENYDDMEERYDRADGMECPWDAICVNRSVDFC